MKNTTNTAENPAIAGVPHNSKWARYNGKCSGCGSRYSVRARLVFVPGQPENAYETEEGSIVFGVNGACAPCRACECGRVVKTKPVRGKFRAEIKCNARCETSAGHDCQCACGGKNHGKAAGW